MVKVFISNCYVSDHILYSICPQLADTLLQPPHVQQWTTASRQFRFTAVCPLTLELFGV